MVLGSLPRSTPSGNQVRGIRDWESLLDGDEDGYVDEYQLGKLEECEQAYYDGVSEHVAFLCEAYAQYLCKSYGIA